MLKLKYEKEPPKPWPFAQSVVDQFNRLERKINQLEMEMQIVMNKLGLIEDDEDEYK